MCREQSTMVLCAATGSVPSSLKQTIKHEVLGGSMGVGQGFDRALAGCLTGGTGVTRDTRHYCKADKNNKGSSKRRMPGQGKERSLKQREHRRVVERRWTTRKMDSGSNSRWRWRLMRERDCDGECDVSDVSLMAPKDA